MVVFVKDAAESISPSDSELVQLLCFGDRWGEWAKGSCGMQGAVGSVVVVERFEFTQACSRWAWLRMRVRSRSSVRQVRIQRSMIAFIRGTRIPVVIVVMPLSARTASKAAVYLLSRSRIR